MRLVTKNSKPEFTLNQRLRMQRVLSAANSMIIQLRIPRGNNLLFILGYPNAIDNKDAICRWILEQEPMLAINNDSYSRLISQLESLLLDATEGGIQ